MKEWAKVGNVPGSRDQTVFACAACLVSPTLRMSAPSFGPSWLGKGWSEKHLPGLYTFAKRVLHRWGVACRVASRQDEWATMANGGETDPVEPTTQYFACAAVVVIVRGLERNNP